MGKEIERKFLVIGNDWRKLAEPVSYRQGYIASENGKTVRVRIAGTKAKLTIKGKSKGISRTEFEYDIPMADAEALLNDFCHKPLIEKTRRKIQFAGFTWEVDEFFGDNEGLIMAEIELEDENQSFTKPDWIGKEVSDDHRYFNAYLNKHPYKSWT